MTNSLSLVKEFSFIQYNVMPFRNLQPNNGHVNDSRYIVATITNNVDTLLLSSRSNEKKATHASPWAVRAIWCRLSYPTTQKNSRSRSRTLCDYDQRSTRKIIWRYDWTLFESRMLHSWSTILSNVKNNTSADYLFVHQKLQPYRHKSSL